MAIDCVDDRMKIYVNLCKLIYINLVVAGVEAVWDDDMVQKFVPTHWMQ